MITLKYWNSLSGSCRALILDKMGICDDALKKEYHHNFNYDSTGKILKAILGSMMLKNGKILVTIQVTPKFPVKSKSKPKPRVMHRYYFRLYTVDDPDDGENVWTEAMSEEEARDEIYDDYHSIVRLELLKIV